MNKEDSSKIAIKIMETPLILFTDLSVTIEFTASGLQNFDSKVSDVPMTPDYVYAYSSFHLKSS